MSSSSSSPSNPIRSLSPEEEAALRSELEQWIDLHLHRQLSGTLLILSKAFAFTRPSFGEGDGEKGELEGLRDTLASLPHTLVSVCKDGDAGMELNLL
jgi:LETM1 and EF-hand domain-containing protein 1, mitochondrial